MSEQQNKDYRAEIDQWTHMWDEVQEKYPEPETEPEEPGFGFGSKQTLGLGAGPDSVPPDDPHDVFYTALETEEILSEEQKTPNPVYPDSVGPDHETTPPVWVSEEIVKEITSLKDKLFEVENKLAKMGGGEKWPEKAQMDSDQGGLLDEIKSLKDKIEKLSSTLGTEHEKSPWVVQRD